MNIQDKITQDFYKSLVDGLNKASNVEKVRELKTHVSEIHQTVFDKYGRTPAHWHDIVHRLTDVVHDQGTLPPRMRYIIGRSNEDVLYN